jgi:AbiJ N-terminal domain 4
MIWNWNIATNILMNYCLWQNHCELKYRHAPLRHQRHPPLLRKRRAVLETILIMAWFSQRKGLKPIRQLVQINEMDHELRNAIWNALYREIFGARDFITHDRYKNPTIYPYTKLLWSDYLREPIDSRPNRQEELYDYIRNLFFNSSWNEVYDFVEFTVACFDQNESLVNALNFALESEMAGYRLIDRKIIELTDEAELDSVEQAINQSKFRAAANHLQRALELIADRQNPDARNSIKESISAVESAAKEVTNLPKATLDDAIKLLEKKGELHPSLKAAFAKLYGYTSDEGGIRHAMLEESNLTKADALFFLVTCSAFINYLKSKI